MKQFALSVAVVFLFTHSLTYSQVGPPGLPIALDKLKADGIPPKSSKFVNNKLSLEQIVRSIRLHEEGFAFDGDNRSRAFAHKDGSVKAEPKSVIEVRNELARAIASSDKVAVVIMSDEHAFYRTLVNQKLPAGSDKDIKTGRTREWKQEVLSTIDGLNHATWYFVGLGGTPYSAEKESPWNRYWKRRPEPSKGYQYTPQENILLFHATEEGVSARVVNAYGETIDLLENLMDVK